MTTPQIIVHNSGMNGTLAQSILLPQKNSEQLLITQPVLRAKMLKARLVNEVSADCVIQRGEHVYFSLHGVADETQRKELAWAVSCLQMGATIPPQHLPDPLRTVLLAAEVGSSPLLKSLLVGALSGVVGGVLMMAMAGLVMTVLDVQAESYVRFLATAVTFILSATIIGCIVSVFFWRRLCGKTAVFLQNITLATTVKMPK
ncbi:MAG: hypothetical protein GY805_21055 [Chloroflexi bacterium]|nr:hypothetical protein [Chloroflexota bacterium]